MTQKRKAKNGISTCLTSKCQRTKRNEALDTWPSYKSGLGFAVFQILGPKDNVGVDCRAYPGNGNVMSRPNHPFKLITKNMLLGRRTNFQRSLVPFLSQYLPNRSHPNQTG